MEKTVFIPSPQQQSPSTIEENKYFGVNNFSKYDISQYKISPLGSAKKYIWYEIALYLLFHSIQVFKLLFINYKI